MTVRNLAGANGYWKDEMDTAARVDGVTGSDATPGPPDLLAPEVLRSLPLPVARFFLHEPRTPPRWRTSLPPIE
jgi:hypothetical protein